MYSFYRDFSSLPVWSQDRKLVRGGVKISKIFITVHPHWSNVNILPVRSPTGQEVKGVPFNRVSEINLAQKVKML